MKRIFKLIAIAILATIAFSCEENDDIQFVANNVAEPQIVTANSTITLTKEALNSPAYTLVWKAGDFASPTPVSYTIEIAKSGTNFEKPLEVGKTTDTFFTWTVKELNDKVIEAGLSPDEEGAIEIRVIASVGSEGNQPALSNISVLSLTPFANEAPKLFLVGAFQQYYGRSAWTPTEAFEMNYKGDGITSIFDAYIKLGADDGFKFISAAADWGTLDGNYGTDGGAQNGTIVNSGGSSDVKPGEAGLYYVKVDIDNLTYQIVKMDWGIIGAATANGWDAETAMTYDFDANAYKISTALSDGEFKLRSKNTGNTIFGSGEDWKFNIGNAGDDAVAEDTGDGNFSTTAGNFDIELAIEITGKSITSISSK